MTALEVYNPGSIGESIVVFGNLADRISRTDFVPQEFRGRPEAVLACMMYGQELGLGPMQSLNLTQSIKGRVGLKPEGMRALVLAAGHKIWTDEFTDTRVVLCGQRNGEDEVERVDWDLARAKNAGLGTGDNWKKYPRAMLLARATSELCRLKFADIVGGLSYTPEELEEFEPVQVAPASSRRRAAPVADAEVVEPPRPQQQHVEHIRPPADVEIVDTKELPPSTGTRKRKPPTGAGGVGVAPEKPARESKPSTPEQRGDVADLIDALKTAGPDWHGKAINAWRAADLPARGVEALDADQAARAFDVLSQVYSACVSAMESAPTLDSSGDAA